MKLTIVDVFAEAPYEGNQLAVIHDAADLDASTMQAIAREINFSESTFVTRSAPGRASIRIFTPGEELPFAGHPVVGSAWVLRGQRNTFSLDVPAGRIELRFADELTWMTPPPAELGETASAEQAASLMGLDAFDIDTEWRPQFMTCGPKFILVCVRSLEALRRVAVDLRLRETLGEGVASVTICRGGYGDGADFAMRVHFYDGIGIREDPATGSANCAFAAFLKSRGKTGRFVVDQGFEIKRPSRIHLDVGSPNAIGGKVQLIATGSLTSNARLSMRDSL